MQMGIVDDLQRMNQVDRGAQVGARDTVVARIVTTSAMENDGNPDQTGFAMKWCNVTNFARRTSCFQCNASKTAHTKDVPVTAAFRQDYTSSHNDSQFNESGNTGECFAHNAASRDDDKGARRRGAGNENVRNIPSSQVLVVRMLPPDIEEGELHVAFAEFDGVQDIRLIRDRVTNLSRGFGFVEFRDIEQSNVAADISALLDNAAAEVVPHFEEPKKMWPPPFETAGGSYVYASEYGLYWDPDSMFYYDAHTKLYHNSFTGTYYRCVNPGDSGAAAFQVFVPPPPADHGAYKEPTTTTKVSVASKSGLSLSLKKDKKKILGISFGIKTTAFTSASSGFEGNAQTKPVGGGPAAPAAGAVSATNIGMKRKSAGDIAKWSQQQRKAKMQDHEGSSTPPVQHEHPGETARAASTTQQSDSSKPEASSMQKLAAGAPPNTADSVIDALTSGPQEVPICLLCRRKFGSLDMLHKHEKLSKLHLANVAKAKQNKRHIAAQYRQHEQEMERDAKKQREEEDAPPTAAPGSNSWSAPVPTAKASPEPTAASLESGIGGKMLKMMGWKSGEGLGKHGTGITAPIKAAGLGRSDTAGLGLKAPLSASVDLSDATTDKERRQRLARARYEADNA
uniref:G-patch domain-containing protein n=1 Tax=Phytophthora ramorum TaxID=164328 RepID=H3GMH6_PHYRM